MPEFPGLSHTEHCRDWDPGIPIDLDKIREKDEVYWEKYRGAPKAFISYEAARRMWGNRYGEVTAIRFIGWSDYLDSDNHLSQDAQKILRRLEPHALGLTFQPVREQGLQAGEESVDFAQLFIGLSFFIIIAALTLTGLLFAFGIERRRTETGVLLALGYEPRLVRKLLLAEGAILSIVGGLLGVCAGLLYHQAILLALKHLWYDVVGVSTLRLHVDPQTLIIGGLLGAVSALATIWFVSGGQFHHSPVDLLRGKSRIKSISKTKNRFNQALALLSLIGATLILLIGERGVFSLDRGIASPGKFFAAGFLSLIGFIAISGIVLSRLELWGVSRNLTVTTAGIRNCVRNRRRSLAVIGSLACGIFLVVSVGANRGDPARFPEKRSSGTGGFALWAETTIPILHDLNEKETKERLGLHGFSDSVRFTPLRVREGDDASCLNLNRTQRPQILGVRPEEFDNLGAFSFAQTTVGHDDHPWLSLKEDWGDDVIPGIADQTVITYGLGKSVGDTLHYLDEQGRSLNVKLVGGLENSIFQGNIIIDEEQFIRKFPSLSGSRIFLVDAPYENQKNLLLDLSDSLQDFGADLTQTSTRLVEFSAVQNGYLSIFLSLGGLGLLLGTIGLGVVVWRHTMERRSEFAILRSLGFSHSALYRLILTEHTPLLLLGTVGGTLSAAIAVLPAMTSSGGQIPYLFIASILISILLSGFFWIQVAAWTALRGDLIPALRDE
ncbi:MAG: hypothetical protein B6244_02480 [Candidatus Cloacimonetes bacterium 4572_55]|nr:MAG: hypothetical protein B6244_02480 [Candidatus Cloacimonetes bacterium 4572_55]